VLCLPFLSSGKLFIWKTFGNRSATSFSLITVWNRSQPRKTSGTVFGLPSPFRLAFDWGLILHRLCAHQCMVAPPCFQSLSGGPDGILAWKYAGVKVTGIGV